MEKQAEISSDAASVDSEIKKMLDAGIHFGHRKTRQHPKMLPYVFGVRNTVSIIDLEKTRVKLDEVTEYLLELIEGGKSLLFVDTKPATREETRALAKQLDMPHVTERWSGGIFTNWKSISERIERLKDLEAKTKSEEWKKYTKKERSDMRDEIKKLNILWGGIKDMGNLPEAIFVVDMKENSLAIKEARKKKIAVVAIADTNADPSLADYPIPANDDALSSVKYILKKVKDAIMKGKKKAKSKNSKQ